jgi:hypothetical protein
VKRDLKTLIEDLKGGKGPQVLLLFGDDLQVQETCNAVLDLIVPLDHRGFNSRRFDGRSASWEQIEASLMTPPFSLAKNSCGGERSLFLFPRAEGRAGREKFLSSARRQKDDAAKLLVDLLVVEG